jgi:diguanylate cyclase (GGDEF)-like protein
MPEIISKNKANIMIVDDNPQNLRLLVELLKEKGHIVRPAPNGKHAISVAEKEEIDLILLDIMMPDMNGYEVCRYFKSEASTLHIPIIFLSALGETFNKIKAFKEGGVDYIAKPFQAEEVLARIDTHLKIKYLQDELEHKNQELEKLVNIDGLTNIPNRRFFDYYLEKEWKLSIRRKRRLSLIMADIDFFKLYNDYYGHLKGDDCLKKVANVFSKALTRPADLPARYGGEEFAIILPETDEHGATSVAKGIFKTLEKENIPHKNSKISNSVTCSMGIITLLPTAQDTIENFIEKADLALYQAKNGGRNRIEMYSEYSEAFEVK